MKLILSLLLSFGIAGIPFSAAAADAALAGLQHTAPDADGANAPAAAAAQAPGEAAAPQAGASAMTAAANGESPAPGGSESAAAAEHANP